MKSGGVILQLGSPTTKSVTYERPTSKPVKAPEMSSETKVLDMENKKLEMKKHLIDILLQQVVEGAKNNISEDGEFSSDNVSQRIFDFAVSLSGGDPETMMMLKDAVMEGFEEAKKILGGQLPQISYETLEKTMQKFDDFFKQM
jgi:hypothetical protein